MADPRPLSDVSVAPMRNRSGLKSSADSAMKQQSDTGEGLGVGGTTLTVHLALNDLTGHFLALSEGRFWP